MKNVKFSANYRWNCKYHENVKIRVQLCTEMAKQWVIACRTFPRWGKRLAIFRICKSEKRQLRSIGVHFWSFVAHLWPPLDTFGAFLAVVLGQGSREFSCRSSSTTTTTTTEQWEERRKFHQTRRSSEWTSPLLFAETFARPCVFFLFLASTCQWVKGGDDCGRNTNGKIDF